MQSPFESPPAAGWPQFQKVTPCHYERVVFRSTPRPSAMLPFAARSAGHRIIDTRQEPPRFRQPYHQFIWGIAGVGKIYFGGRKFLLRPGEVARFQPGDVQWYGAEEGQWEYRWWTLDGRQAATAIASFGLVWQAPRMIGPCPVDLSHQLESALADAGPTAEREAATIVFRLLAEIVSRAGAAHSQIVDEAAGIIEREFQNPQFGIGRLAATLRLHRATLTRNFTVQMGMTPVEYLASVRVQHAVALLKTTTLNVTEIAYRTGFTDPNYFSRSIKRATGLTPTEFRAGQAR